MDDLVSKLRDLARHTAVKYSEGMDVGSAASLTVYWKAADRIEALERLLQRVLDWEPMEAGIEGAYEAILPDLRAALSGTTAPDALVEALEEVCAQERHLRSGGADASDLAGLEEGLQTAVHVAAAALSAHRGESGNG